MTTLPATPDDFLSEFDVTRLIPLEWDEHPVLRAAYNDPSIGAYQISGRYRGDKVILVISMAIVDYSDEIARTQLLSFARSNWPPDYKRA